MTMIPPTTSRQRITLLLGLILQLVWTGVHHNVVNAAEDDDLSEATTAVSTDASSSRTAVRQQRHGPSLFYHVDEEQPSGTLVGDVGRDVGLCPTSPAACASTRFSAVGQRTPRHELFDVEQVGGRIVTSRRIDREEVCPSAAARRDVDCSVIIDVAVQTANEFDIIKIRISIVDINDNPPVFTALSNINFSISESVTPNDPSSAFQLPVATDADNVPFAVVGYRLEDQSGSNATSTPFQLVLVNSTSFGINDVRLTLVSALDRETVDRYELTLVAFDGGNPPLSSSVNLVVNVEDSNDNSPTFERPMYAVSVPETTRVGSSLIQLTATDPDLGPNGRVRYRFSTRAQQGRDDFYLDDQSGIVSLRRPLDHGRQSVYRIGLLADDEGPGGVAAFAVLSVQVVDVNDHRPVITVHAAAAADSGQPEVEEGQTAVIVVTPSGPDIDDMFVAHVMVTDQDGGENGRVTCSLEYSLLQAANVENGGSVAPSNTPTFDIPNENTAKSEKSDVDPVVDESTLTPANMTYSIDFRFVQLYEGEYKLVATVDNSSRADINGSEYQLTISCSDHGSPVPLTSSYEFVASIRFSASSLESNIPSEDQSLTVLFPTAGNDTVRIVADHLPVGHVIANILAAGGIGSGAMTYELVEGNGSVYFDVGRISGHVTLSRLLDSVDDVTVFELVIGVGNTDVGSLALATLYVVVSPAAFLLPGDGPSMTSQADDERNNSGGSWWSLWFGSSRWQTIVGITVASCSLVLAVLLFVSLCLLYRKSRRRRPRSAGRKMTSSYHVAVEFRAADGSVGDVSMYGLNNVAYRDVTKPRPCGSVDSAINIPGSVPDGSLESLIGVQPLSCNDSRHAVNNTTKAMSMPDILLIDLGSTRQATDSTDLVGCYGNSQTAVPGTGHGEESSDGAGCGGSGVCRARCTRCGLPFRTEASVTARTTHPQPHLSPSPSPLTTTTTTTGSEPCSSTVPILISTSSPTITAAAAAAAASDQPRFAARQSTFNPSARSSPLINEPQRPPSRTNNAAIITDFMRNSPQLQQPIHAADSANISTFLAPHPPQVSSALNEPKTRPLNSSISSNNNGRNQQPPASAGSKKRVRFAPNYEEFDCEQPADQSSCSSSTSPDSSTPPPPADISDYYYNGAGTNEQCLVRSCYPATRFPLPPGATGVGIIQPDMEYIDSDFPSPPPVLPPNSCSTASYSQTPRLTTFFPETGSLV